MTRHANQPLLPDGFPTVQASADGDRAGSSAESVAAARKRARAVSFRFRHQLPPWRVLLWLPPTALGIHWLPIPPMWARMLAVLAIGALAGWHQYARRARWDYRAYALTCVALAALWTMLVVRAGVTGGVGRFSLLILLVCWVPLAWLWWDRHRVRTADTTPVTANPEDQFLADWQTLIEPAYDWVLSAPLNISAGRSYRLQLVPGQTIEDAEQTKRKVASLLRISRSRLTFESREGDIPGVTDDESVITLIVTPKTNPHFSEIQGWPGPSLDKATGLYRHGVYPDSPTLMRLYRIENGHPIRACNGLWTGTTGSGKSRGNTIKIAEQAKSGMFVTWYADGKNGASAPELEQHVDWYSDTLDETIKLSRAAWRVMKVRAKKIKQLHQEAFRGRRLIWLGDPELPFLQIILDEAQEFLKHPVVAKLVKALLRMGNECGIGLDLLTQVPLLVELGGASGDGGAEVIRAMAKSGNVAVYKADESFTGRVTLTSDLEVNPSDLPRIPGVCFVASHTARSAVCRGYYADKEQMFAWLTDMPVLSLDAASARAAGEDYATRQQRADDNVVAPEDIDLSDLEAELAVLLGERLPGQPAPGQAVNALTVKQAVFEVVKDAGGPVKRDQIATELAARGQNPSKSAVDQALRWWCERSHIHQPGHGLYDLINREGTENAAAGSHATTSA
jgi:hypothetical protein